MARPRKNETSINITPASASAAPARRKTASATRARATSKATADSGKPALDELSGASEVPGASRPETIDYRPSHDEISALAYSYWVERGYAEGCPEQDWLRAESELCRRSLATA
jgi:Protein of unknown function (DUF2934)